MQLPCFSCQRFRCMTGRSAWKRGTVVWVYRFQDQGSDCLCSVEMVIRKTWWLVIPQGYLRLTSRWGDPRTHEHMPGTNSHTCNQIPIRSINHQQLVNTHAPKFFVDKHRSKGAFKTTHHGVIEGHKCHKRWSHWTTSNPSNPTWLRSKGTAGTLMQIHGCFKASWSNKNDANPSCGVTLSIAHPPQTKT